MVSYIRETPKIEPGMEMRLIINYLDDLGNILFPPFILEVLAHPFHRVAHFSRLTKLPVRRRRLSSLLTWLTIGTILGEKRYSELSNLDS